MNKILPSILTSLLILTSCGLGDNSNQNKAGSGGSEVISNANKNKNGPSKKAIQIKKIKSNNRNEARNLERKSELRYMSPEELEKIDCSTRKTDIKKCEELKKKATRTIPFDNQVK